MKNLKCTILALTMGASVFIGGKAFAQVPSYVPTNGLVGWWPFNGNANDESGNGNNGTVNGATLSSDRFGNASKAYSFDGVNDYIITNSNSLLGSNSRTFSLWIYSSGIISPSQEVIIDEGGSTCGTGFAIANQTSNKLKFDNTCSVKSLSNSFLLNQWNNIIVVFNNTISNNLNGVKFYLNGIEILDYSPLFGNLSINTGNSISLTIGKSRFTTDSYYFFGKIDDIGIWNRALTQHEITDLYKSCGHEITTQPVNANLNAASTAQFSVNAISGSSFQWQSNPLNMGWQNITNNSSYSGTTSNALSVSNVAVSNHNQPFRAIVNAGTCIDTSDIVQIIIGDTCLSTIYDTLLTTVTDTLIINTTLSLPSPNNENTIKIYPNPASDHITIDNGNFTSMAGYSIKITNNAGQQVFQNAINQAQFNVDLSTWSGNGLYFVHLIDSQNNTVTIRKIVLQ